LSRHILENYLNVLAGTGQVFEALLKVLALNHQ
jgi:hypothetical protein